MMRKIGLNRPNRLSLGPKKVSPPQVPGDDAGGVKRLSGVYSDSGVSAPGSDVFNTSLESCSSEGAVISGTRGGSAGVVLPSEGGQYGASSSDFPSHHDIPGNMFAARPGTLGVHCEKAEMMTSVHQFKEPYSVPYRSMSTVSSPTQENSPSKGSRNSMSSIDSGWASNSVPGFSSFCSRNSNSSLNSDKTSFSNEELESRPLVHQSQSQRRLSTISNGPPPPKRQSSTSSFTTHQGGRNSLRTSGSQESVGSSRQSSDRMTTQTSHYSSSSSLGSSRNGEESICTLDLRQMIEQCAHPDDVVNCWLSDLRFEEYFALFAAAGYDLPTISRMTPEDLTAIGIKKPHHRKKLTAEIGRLEVPDCLPVRVPQVRLDSSAGAARHVPLHSDDRGDDGGPETGAVFAGSPITRISVGAGRSHNIHRRP
jgi:hypothetical protein